VAKQHQLLVDYMVVNITQILQKAVSVNSVGFLPKFKRQAALNEYDHYFAKIILTASGTH